MDRHLSLQARDDGSAAGIDGMRVLLGESRGKVQSDTESASSPATSMSASSQGWMGELETVTRARLEALAERIAGSPPRHPSMMERESEEHESEKTASRWTACFKSDDIDRVRTAYRENSAAAGADSGSRCSCIVMLNVALGQLLKLRKKETRARSSSTRKVQMAALTTETIEKAMAQLQKMGYAKAVIPINFFDRRNKTAGTLKPERLKRSVQRAVLGAATKKGCWYAFGMSIMDGYHSVLLLVDKTGSAGKIYWLDQFSSGIDDNVSDTLDQRITTKTQTWWQAVKDTKSVGYNTTVRVWLMRRLISP